jgi:hypothetical protein
MVSKVDYHIWLLVEDVMTNPSEVVGGNTRAYLGIRNY